MHTCVLGILPPGTSVPESPQAFANLVHYYDSAREIAAYKAYLTEADLWQRWLQTLPQELVAGTVSVSDGLFSGPVSAGDLEEDDHGYYLWSTKPLHARWKRWHLGGRWDGILQGQALREQNACQCASWEDHLRNNTCLVSELPPDLSPDVLVLPDGSWHNVQEGKQGNAVITQRQRVATLLRAHQGNLVVIVDCSLVDESSEDDPLEENQAPGGDAQADPTKAAAVFKGLLPSYRPSPMTRLSLMYSWAIGCNLRVHARRQMRAPATTEELLEEWLFQLQTKRNLPTLWRTYRYMRHFLFWYEAGWQLLPTLADLNQQVFDMYATALLHRGQVRSIQLHVRVVQAWAAWLQADPLPAAKVTLLLNPAKLQLVTPRQPLTQTQVLALLNAARSECDRALLLLLLGAGMRISELARLTLQDVHLQPTGGYLASFSRKTGRSHLIPLHSSVSKALSRYLAFLVESTPALQAQAAYGVEQSTEWRRMPLFPNRKGKALSVQAISGLVAGLAQQTGVIPTPGITAHCLQVTFASAYYQHNSGDIVGLSAILGYQSPRWPLASLVPPQVKDPSRPGYLRYLDQDALQFLDEWLGMVSGKGG